MTHQARRTLYDVKDSMMGMGDLEGRGFVVVGGAGGVGRAVVLLAAQRGASVLFGGQPGSEDLAAQLLADARPVGAAERISCVACDLSSQSEVDRLFDLADERLPGLHVLVIDLVEQARLHQGKPLIETSLADWNQGLSLCLRQPFLITQRALEEFLVGGEGGRVVYVVSASADSAASHVSVVAGQTALGSFVRSITKELGRRRIVCNAVVIHGDMPQQTPPGRPDTVAETVLFLASNAASFVNGEVWEVRG